MKPKTQEQLLLELEDLRARLDEAEDTLRAIRSGEVDALIVSGVGGEQVYTLKGADRSYRALIEDMNEGAITLTSDGVILYCNRRFAEMLKTPLEKVIGSTIRTWIAPDGQKILQALLRQDATETRRHGELELLAGDGTIIPGYLSTNVLGIEESPELFCLVVTDLSESKRTEAIAASEKLAQELLRASHKSHLVLMAEIEGRKQVERELRESKELTEAVVENVPLMIFLKESKDLRFVIFNRAGEELLGHEHRDLIGKSDLDLFPLEQAAFFMAKDREVLDGEAGMLDIPEEPILTAKKGQRILHTRKICIRGSDGTTKFLLGISEDITERKQAEAAIQREQVLSNTIINSIPGTFYILDENGRYFRWNAYQRDEILGKPDDQMAGMNAIDTIHAEDRTLIQSRIANVLKDGKDETVESRVLLRGGPAFIWMIMTGRRMMIAGRPFLVGIGIDITERRQAEEKLQDTLESLRKAVNTTIQVMISTIEARDPYTSGHQSRSADLARTIATEMGLPREQIEGIHMAGSIHDIGKISIPSEILSKPTKLSDLEFKMIKEHSRKGYEMLKDVESRWPLAQIVYQHHERMDGSGYPRNLKGDEILMEARILAVADVVESMASHRPYRPALGIDVALEEIEKNKGIFYDDAVADACLKLFQEKGYQLT